jgi:hypothetical protein
MLDNVSTTSAIDARSGPAWLSLAFTPENGSNSTVAPQPDILSLNALSGPDGPLIEEPAPVPPDQYTMLPKGAGWLPGEPQPAPVKPYPGAYYTARRSSRWHWYGEEFQVTLGTPHLDPTRKVWRKDLQRFQPLDGFSIYGGGTSFGRGGKGRAEVDAGLSFDYPSNKDGTTDYSAPRSFRPFIYTADGWRFPCNLSFNPGDTVDISVNMTNRPNTMHFHINDVNDPKKSYDTDFAAAGFSPGADVQFKEGGPAIDQVGRQGLPVQPTNSSFVGTHFLRSELIAANGTHVPWGPQRFFQYHYPSGHHFRITPDAKATAGEETIDVYGNPADNKP